MHDWRAVLGARHRRFSKKIGGRNKGGTFFPFLPQPEESKFQFSQTVVTTVIIMKNSNLKLCVTIEVACFHVINCNDLKSRRNQNLIALKAVV